MGEIVLKLENIVKSFGNTEIIKGINLEVEKGEFITLLGSSGCGKTTTLRMIAGLETPNSGRVFLNGKDVTNLSPEKRDVNTVFQNYALFPHMNIESNVGYSLKLKKIPKDEAKKIITDALAQVQLEGYEKRMPSELSGGQRQRVAIARAIVNKPGVLLLDEPLGALDLQLRRQMQQELKKLQAQLGITFIYITHDQEEALNMSSKIAVMRNGNFEQIGTAQEIYERPRSAYVAKFVGEANIISGKALSCEDSFVYTDICGVKLGAVQNDFDYKNGETTLFAVRSENIEFCKNDGVPAIINEKSFAGGMLRVELKLENGEVIIASRHGMNLEFNPGEKVFIAWKKENAVCVSAEGI